jgi:S1-C subfamily serine protease
MKLRVVLTIAFSLLNSCLTLTAKEKDQFIQTIQMVKRSTVAVACLQTKPNGETGLASIEGTGFFVSSDGTFVTAGHVARGLYLAAPPRQSICEIPAIYVPKDGWKEGAPTIDLGWFKISTCKGDDDLDLAVCKPVENPFISKDINVKPSVVLLDTSIQKEGSAIAFTGFPLSTVQPITARAAIGAYWGLASESNPREIVIDHNNWPGASGSPVYLPDGKVVGLILKRGLNEATGLAFARSAIFIKEFLAKNPLTETKTEEKPPK